MLQPASMSGEMPGLGPFCAVSGLHFILASTSPRRQAMLRELGISFTVFDAGKLEPEAHDGELASSFAMRSARSKCEAALSANENLPNEILLVLAADTVVCIDGQILGKPRNEGNALEMLRLLNGRRHEVHTAVAINVRWPERTLARNFVVTTGVQFAAWPEAVLAAYARSGEPLDKAGAYAIQGRGAFLVKNIAGSWSNVVGLPLSPLVDFLLANNLLAISASRLKP